MLVGEPDDAGVGACDAAGELFADLDMENFRAPGESFSGIDAYRGSRLKGLFFGRSDECEFARLKTFLNVLDNFWPSFGLCRSRKRNGNPSFRGVLGENNVEAPLTTSMVEYVGVEGPLCGP